MFKDITRVVYDKTFKVVVYKDKINIINYAEVLAFDEENILIKTNEYLVKIKGMNLAISKLYNEELLIEGKIKMIEFG